ncbi:hypothetical protein KY304_01390, partial [Candidatus Woesearchaeota archaeon]|nr:hypothetical protein [Candidatus Woesearchaeota archaeon]
KNENEACSFWIKILQDSFRIIPGEIKIPGTIKVYKPPVNCIICSRIKFSDDLKEYFKKNKKSEITSFDMWLRYNYPITGSLSYYEHIVEGQSSLKNSFSTRYPKYSLDFPLTVLYEKIYVRKDFFESLQDWRWLGTINNPFGIIISEIQKYTVYELNYVKLVPYTQESLIDQKNGEGCIFILD